MSETGITARVNDAMKAAMRARERERLATIRLIQSEFKRIIVDERVDIDDARALAILDRMIKQRRDSSNQYREAGRAELAAQEDFEIGIIQEFLPDALSDEELDAVIEEAIADSGASGMQAMGPVMAYLKPRVQGRADMSTVSQRVKARLAG